MPGTEPLDRRDRGRADRGGRDRTERPPHRRGGGVPQPRAGPAPGRPPGAGRRRDRALLRLVQRLQGQAVRGGGPGRSRARPGDPRGRLPGPAGSRRWCLMRVLVAGATGVIGQRLVRVLLDGGHEVAGITRSPARAGGLTAMGSRPLVGDVYDAPWVLEAVGGFGPEVLVNQVTDLPDDAADVAGHRSAN